MILYEDDDIIVCYKPAGVPVQSASVRTKDMISILRTHLQENGGQNDRGQTRSNHRSDKFVGKNTGMKNAEIKTVGTKSAHEEVRDVYVVHRLDQPVEGVMVFAKTKRAAADLSRQAAGDGMKKRYHAVVELTEAAACVPCHKNCRQSQRSPDDKRNQEAVQDNSWHTLVDYLVKDGRNNRSFVSEAGKKDAKRAELRYRILKMEEKKALAEIELKTGRHHQIRVQMAHAGMPLYGDRKYNPGNMVSSGIADALETHRAGRDVMKEEPSAQSLALCAVSLTFRHPLTQKEMTFSVEPKAEIFHKIA